MSTPILDELEGAAGDYWGSLPPHVRTALADLLAARDRRVRAVLDEYFDFDVDPWDDHDAACPAPEDTWRLHRDLKAALAATELAQSAAATEENRP